MEALIAYRGAKVHIEYAVCLNGRSPSKEFFDTLDPEDQRKVMTLFVRMGDQGKIWNEEKFKIVEDQYYAFKSFQIRILCRFQPGNRLILLYGLWKQKDRYDPADIAKAERIFTEYAEYTRRRQR